MKNLIWTAPAAAALLLASCGQETSAPKNNAPEVSAAPVDNEATAPALMRIEAVVQAAARPETDTADDEARQPAAVLAFIGIEPGMTVFEMEGGGGYYTELFSPLAGSGGKIILQNPQSFDEFLGDTVTNRLANDRLANVRLSRTNFDELDAADSSVDIVTWFLGPHELYFTPSDGVSLGEVGPAYAEIFRILKPAGAFVILDHAAAPGAPETTGDTLHRIDPAIVKALAADAGFVLVDESNILRNPDDDYEMGVFDPAVRRKTDRFLLKYKRPE